MSSNVQMRGEYETEPIRGLPESLPDGEEILWQGAPRWQSLARRAFHVRKVAVYFAILAAWRIESALSAGEAPWHAATSLAALVGLGFVAVGVLSGIAWLNARATVYTVTNRRVVLRFGVALDLAVNLPFCVLQSAAVRAHPDGSGDISLSVTGAETVGYLMMWPHARPWRFGRHVEPMLRSVPDAASVAEVLAHAIAASEGPTAMRADASETRSAGRPSVAAATI